MALFLARSGAAVRACDRRRDVALPAELARSAELELGVDSAELLDGVDLVVPSPGVPASAPLLAAALRRAILVLGEVEIAAACLGPPLAAITGTNGKSTTTVLAAEMLAAGGRAVFAGGNLGPPLVEAVGGRFDAVVAEVSSFQLEWVRDLRPRAAAWLNLSEDHLDRHGDLGTYGAVKARLFARQGEGDLAALNRDDPRVWEWAGRLCARVVGFGAKPDGPGALLEGERIVVREGGGEFSLSLERTRLRHPHDRENAMAAALVARSLGATREEIQCGLDGFSGLAHRMEWVAEIGGVTYVDDSKSTNVGALRRSLDAFPDGGVVLVAGGEAKRSDYSSLRGVLARKVRSVQVYGAAAELLRESWGEAVEVACHGAFADAVRAAGRAARPGEVVLLSPGCASFDQFPDYGARGDAFRRIVAALAAERRAAGGAR